MQKFLEDNIIIELDANPPDFTCMKNKIKRDLREYQSFCFFIIIISYHF